MANSHLPKKPKPPLNETIAEKAERKLKARQKKTAVWFGLGMFGLIGWSIAIPTIIGIALGVWIDRSFSSRFSWTLMLLLGGLILGCFNAWHWLQKEAEHD
jgi:ATP synthase protein I